MVAFQNLLAASKFYPYVLINFTHLGEHHESYDFEMVLTADLQSVGKVGNGKKVNCIAAGPSQALPVAPDDAPVSRTENISLAVE